MLDAWPLSLLPWARLKRKPRRTVSQDAPSIRPSERVFDALGDPTRRLILHRLREGPRPVVEISRGLPVSRPAVSQHLRVLKDAGLVIDRAQGNRRLYAVDPNGLSAVRAFLELFWTNALTRFVAASDRAQQSSAKARARP
jgi:DNA-binding transcriptional ArsR family regulator